MPKRNVIEVIITAFELVPVVGSSLSKIVKFADSLFRLFSPQTDDEESDALKKIIEMLNRTEHREFGVVAISACNYDYFIQIDKILADFECTIKRKEEFPGGSGANTICGLAKLCTPPRTGEKASIVSCVKNDERGKTITRSLIEHGVNVDFLIRDDKRDHHTGITTILVESSGKREILIEPGINDHLSRLIREKGLLDDLKKRVENSRILHLTSFVDSEEMDLQQLVLERYKTENTVVSFTPGALYVEKGLEDLFQILNHTNIIFLYKEQLDKLLERGGIKRFNKNLTARKEAELFFKWKIRKGINNPMILVIKDSLKIQNGRICENYISIASSFGRKINFFGHSNFTFKPDSAIVDTTGAGDAIAAGFLYGLLKGKKDIRSYANIAFVLATYVSTKFGTRPGLIDSNTLNQALERLM